MVQCFVPKCNHRSGKNDCKWIKFPTSPRKRNKWKKVIRRADASPNKYARVCSCHFKEGDKNLVPEYFAWNKDKRLSPKFPKLQHQKRVQPSGGVVRHLSFQEGRENLGDHDMDGSGSCVDRPISPVLLERCDSERRDADAIREEPAAPVSGEEAASAANSLSNEGSAENPSLHLEVESLRKKCSDNEAEIERLRLEVERQKMRCSDFVVVNAENTLLRSENDRLKEDLRRYDGVFRFDALCDSKNSDKLVSHFTGLPNKETFYALLKMFDNFDVQYVRKWTVRRLNKESQLLMTLMKLRRGLSNICLGLRFKVDESTVSNVFTSWVLALHHVLVKNLMATIPSAKKNRINLPECFKEYPSTRMVIDCTEVSTENPSLILNQNRMFSNYKHRITSKGLVGIAPNGLITFASKLYAGSTSDRKIVIDSGVLNCVVPGDSIMADKGFNIEDLMPDGVGLNIPPFKTNPQFTSEEVDLTSSIARARIHVERAIARLKRFLILQFIPESICHYASQIFQVFAALTNFQKPLIGDESAEEGGSLED